MGIRVPRGPELFKPKCRVMQVCGAEIAEATSSPRPAMVGGIGVGSSAHGHEHVHSKSQVGTETLDLTEPMGVPPLEAAARGTSGSGKRQRPKPLFSARLSEEHAQREDIVPFKEKVKSVSTEIKATAPAPELEVEGGFDGAPTGLCEATSSLETR